MVLLGFAFLIENENSITQKWRRAAIDPAPRQRREAPFHALQAPAQS